MESGCKEFFSIHEHFRSRRLTKESDRAGAQTIGTGLQDYDQVANVGAAISILSTRRSSGVQSGPTTVAVSRLAPLTRLPQSAGKLRRMSCPRFPEAARW